MSLIVQKYGSSSVADAEKIKNVARRAAKAKAEGNQLVVVVSAMGDTADNLTKPGYCISEESSDREIDVLLSTGEIVSSTLLAMALGGLGCKAISLPGAQAGIHSDSSFRGARILRIGTKRVISELRRGNIVIVAGFQGMTGKRDIATLGRGGSHTTALLWPLAWALRSAGYTPMLKASKHQTLVLCPMQES